MKKVYTLFLSIFLSSLAIAQSDTLLWEDFESETIDYILNDYPTGDANLYPEYLNFDIDGVADGSGADRPDEWFLAFGFADVDSTNTVLASNSWLTGFVDGAENWLITPRIHIQDAQANLYWKSAPFQLPRYMDGYQVLVSTESNIETDFLDTLAVFAEFEGALTADIEDTATYVFSPGTMHTELQYDSADVTRHTGVLQQWSASLANYEGENIFIAFRHQSDDDNLISIDDILVLGTGSVGVDEIEEVSEFRLYPNPVSSGDGVTVDYSLATGTDISYSIQTIDGREVISENGHLQLAGRHSTKIDLQQLNAGTYIFMLKANDTILTERFVLSD